MSDAEDSCPRPFGMQKRKGADSLRGPALIQNVRGVVMSGSGESGSHVRQLRQEADALNKEAERATAPEERQRLQDKARKLLALSEQESAMAAGDIYPQE